jgi:glycosyltransferase involved in cell wall biosynthesis
VPVCAPITVLQVITSTHRRGAETFAVDLGAALGDRVAVVDTVALRMGGDGPVVDVDVLGGAAWAATRALRARAARADVVVAHGSSTLLATALATARPGAARPPFVYRLIGDPGYWTPDLRRRLQVASLLRRAAAVATYDAASADRVVTRYLLPPHRVHVIPKGIDTAPFAPVTPDERADARRRHGIAAPGPVIAWVGALSAEKDPLLATSVTALLPGATLLVAGAGPLGPSMADRPGVQLVGPVERTRDVLAAADVLLLTSRTEGVPGVVLEAGLIGLPVVAVDVGAVGAVAIDGVTGRLVSSRDPAALAAAVLEAVGRRDEWGAAATGLLHRSADIGAVADRWVELLLDVVGVSRSSRR